MSTRRGFFGPVLDCVDSTVEAARYRACAARERPRGL